ncbi:MAG TPA: hypothetical protein VMZ27_01625, partial [Candidatus Saccharimonadales bacterium]|nr:hypothetical protein [Candidatus Saccharimonadales bacterium]
ETMLSQQKTINGLRDEIRRLEEQLRAVSNSSKQTVNQESIQTLVNAVREVEQKRISDNRNVLNRVNEAVTEIQKILRDRSTPPSVVKATPPPNADPMPVRTNAAPRRAGQGSFTVVRQGENLPLLISRLNKQGIKITQKQVADANPEIKDWQKIKAGDKIRIVASR